MRYQLSNHDQTTKSLLAAASQGSCFNETPKHFLFEKENYEELRSAEDIDHNQLEI